jgi:hypothetical protein
MGYSCSTMASFTLDGIVEIMMSRGVRTFNGLPNGFWARGREQDYGAITGTVWKTIRRLTDEERRRTAAEYVGSFRIEPDGRISRFPGLSKEDRRAAEAYGTKKFQERYQKTP